MSRYSVTTREPGASDVLTVGRTCRPRSTAFLATRPGGQHDAGIGRVGAACDGGDHDVAVPQVHDGARELAHRHVFHAVRGGAVLHHLDFGVGAGVRAGFRAAMSVGSGAVAGSCSPPPVSGSLPGRV